MKCVSEIIKVAFFFFPQSIFDEGSEEYAFEEPTDQQRTGEEKDAEAEADTAGDSYSNDFDVSSIFGRFFWNIFEISRHIANQKKFP